MASILTRVSSQLAGLHAVSQMRGLAPPQGHDFSSNDYFCLSRDAGIVEAVKRGVEKYGYGSTSSRFIRGERDIYQRLQKSFADFIGTERSLLFSSGYAANLGVLSTLIQKDDLVFSDELNHASLIDGLRLSGANIVIFPHLDLDFLRTQLASSPKNRHKFLVTESLFSMDGDIAPLDCYAELSRKHDLGLIIDEAHAIGIYGHRGAGLIDHFAIRDQVLCSTAGMGKAFGCLGAIVAGGEEVVELILQRARTLMYTTALPPVALCAIEQALKIIIEGDTMRQQLLAHSNFLAQSLSSPRPDRLSSPILPVILGDNVRALRMASSLREAGFDIRAIRPPTVPAGSARLRITSNICHTQELMLDVARLIRAAS